jgi:UDP:flavonoid glycosyltransferase YjiC (YdhE family)
MSKTCLFVINGLGMGNSTRCHAVIEHLAAAGCRVHVLTSGNGLNYFEGKSCVQSLTPMASFFYSGTKGGISGWSTLKSLHTLYGISRTKRHQVAEAVRKIQPDIAVTDSEYTIAPLRKSRIPIVGLNTSEMVVDQYLKLPAAPGTRSHFWFVEFSDYLFHRHYCDFVLSPFPLRTPTRHPRRFRRIGLIIRRELQEAAPRADGPFPAPRELKRVVFMLSGSVHASRIQFGEQPLPFQVDVVGRTGESRENLTYHGRQMNNTGLLAKADALVINGGYSAVSEAFWLRKPVFVVPIGGHAEQYVNACLVRDLGLGFIATEDDVLNQLLEMHRRNEWIGRKPAPDRFELDGAREAAAAILERLGQLSPGNPA